MTKPALSPHRKQRGMATQRIVADYLRTRGFPWVTDAGPGRSGPDTLNAPGLAIEVKARRDLSLPKWLRQAAGYDGLPLVIHRPDGFGEASVGMWPATFRLEDAVNLLRAAGYGDPLPGDTASIVANVLRNSDLNEGHYDAGWDA